MVKAVSCDVDEEPGVPSPSAELVKLSSDSGSLPSVCVLEPVPGDQGEKPVLSRCVWRGRMAWGLGLLESDCLASNFSSSSSAASFSSSVKWG